MKKELYIKENGVTTHITRDIISDDMTLIGFFSQIFNIEDRNYTKEQIDEIKFATFKMLQSFSCKSLEKKILFKLNKYIMLAKTKEDYLQIVKLLSEGYKVVLDDKKMLKSRFGNSNSYKNKKNMRVSTNFDLHINNTPELVLSIAIKKIISTYYYNILISLNRETLIKLMSMKKNNENVDNMLNLLNLSIPENCNKEISQFYKNIFIDTLDDAYDMKQIHLCWENCQNARADLCPKIKDKIKKRIEDYKFITDGYQLYDERENLDQFIVNVCKKYIKEQPKKLDYCETLQLKKDFITSYYNAENFQETPVYAELVKSKRN